MELASEREPFQRCLLRQQRERPIASSRPLHMETVIDVARLGRRNEQGLRATRPPRDEQLTIAPLP
jgi:hypothetical protein